MDNRIVIGDMKYIAKNFKQISTFENKTILITGCAGFLGFYFTYFFHHLMESGIRIKSLVLLDNFILGRPQWISQFKDSRKIHIRSFDISKDDIGKIKHAKKADYVIHLASIASPTYYRKYPIQTIDANVWGLRNLLDFYKNIHLEGFLFFSSSEIYGDPTPDRIPTDEEYRGNVSCIGPRACYDESKRFGETLCYVYTNIYKMPISVVRPFNNYGPGMSLNDKRVPADFAKAVLNGKDIEIYSGGSSTRTFCYVSDAIVGYLKALILGKYDYFNIGMDRPEISIQQLAQIYIEAAFELLSYEGKIVYKSHRDKDYLTHNPLRRCPDISKARKLLRFNPQIKIEEGIRRFLKYLQETDQK